MTFCVQIILRSWSLCPVGRCMLKRVNMTKHIRAQCIRFQPCSTETSSTTKPTTVTAVTSQDSENLVIPDHINDTKVISLMKAAYNLGIEMYEIEEHIANKPNKEKLLCVPLDRWIRILKRLLHHGFGGDVVVSMISRCPFLLNADEEKLTKGILVWMSCQFGENLMLELLGKYPELISVPQNIVFSRVTFLANYMESKPRVGKMLLIAPSIIQQDWKELKRKIEYLDDLHIDKTEIVNTGVLRLSLFDIKTRYEFLIRAGLYRLPKKKQIKKTIKNPKVNEIVNASKIEFANKVGGMSLTEFEVFSEMYKKEFEDNEELGSEYESEEEWGEEEEDKRK